MYQWYSQITLFTLTLLTMGIAGAVPAPREGSVQKHYVFAHYMVCFPDYGRTVDGYKRDIREAQAAGIDGFALNEGAWTNEPQYVESTKLIFQAAKELGTNFKLFFSLDLATLNPVYIPEMLKTYANHTNYLHNQGRPVVSTFGGELGVDWKTLLGRLSADGYHLYFVPFFYPRPNITELPDYAVCKANYQQWADVVDGMFLFGAAGTDTQLAASNAAYAKAMHEVGKLYMAGYSPYYWGTAQPGRRYFETRGGAGIDAQWQSIIASNADWVEIVTWNDFNESYISPIDHPEQYMPYLFRPLRHNHAGYLELTKFYIAWYKTGKRPPIKDALFYVYRVHPKTAVATQQKPVNPPNDYEEPGFVAKAVTDFHGEVKDALYVTVMLTAPAELRVSSGGTAVTQQLKAGINQVEIPFAPGAQSFAVYRHGRCLIQHEGEPIQEKPDHYNYFPCSGYAYAR